MVRDDQIPVVTGRIAALRQRIVDDEPLVHSLVATALVLGFTFLLLFAKG
jgi:multisubunit Na+/H+ antiporter MnhC subunit